MSDEEEQIHIIPYRRRFYIKKIPQWKIFLSDEQSKLDINRIFFPIYSEKILEIHPLSFTSSKPIEYSAKHISSRLYDLQPVIVDSSSKTQSIMNIINHQLTETDAYDHEEYRQLSTVRSNEHQQISSTKTSTSSYVRTVKQSLSPPTSQPIPDLIINDKQTTKRISNETNSTHLSKFITLTPINSSTKEFFKNNSPSSNHTHNYPTTNIFTLTSTLLFYPNSLLAQAHAIPTTSKPFLSDTIFIFLIATLTLIILLLCLGLFCLCRRTSKRNISPSFDGGSYVGLNEQSFDHSTYDYEVRHSKDENNISFFPNHSSSSSSSVPIRTSTDRLFINNEQISSPKNLALHRTVRNKYPMIKNKKLKKKRMGFCCCKSKQRSSITVNARTRE